MQFNTATYTQQDRSNALLASIQPSHQKRTPTQCQTYPLIQVPNAIRIFINMDMTFPS